MGEVAVHCGALTRLTSWLYFGTWASPRPNCCRRRRQRLSCGAALAPAEHFGCAAGSLQTTSAARKRMTLCLLGFVFFFSFQRFVFSAEGWAVQSAARGRLCSVR